MTEEIKDKTHLNVIYNKQNIPIPIYEDETRRIYLHSQYSVDVEKEQVYEAYYDDDKKVYVFFGFGFGYHIEKFVEMGLEVKVFVLNSQCFELAKACIDLNQWTNNANVEIITRDNNLFEKHIRNIDNNKSKLIFHTPSLEIMDDCSLKEKIQFLHIKINTFKRFKKDMRINYSSNIKNMDYDILTYLIKLQNKNLLIAGAGPSLSYDISFIEKARNKLFVLSVGTALKPLLKNGITPDAVIISDPQENVYNQISGVDIQIPLISLSTAYKGLFDIWKGDKIICYQEGFSPKDNDLVINTGGSVTTTALDIGIQASAKKIILAGCDFSYAENFTHIKGTEFYREIDIHNKKLIKVDNYNRSFNYTSRNLLMYKVWMEDRVKGESVDIFNITKNGAKIKGTKRVSEDILMESL